MLLFTVVSADSVDDYDSIPQPEAEPIPQPEADPQVANRIYTKPQYRPASIRTKPEKPKVALRNFFPENWLFELININEDILKRCKL